MTNKLTKDEEDYIGPPDLNRESSRPGAQAIQPPPRNSDVEEATEVLSSVVPSPPEQHIVSATLVDSRDDEEDERKPVFAVAEVIEKKKRRPLLLLLLLVVIVAAAVGLIVGFVVGNERPDNDELIEAQNSEKDSEDATTSPTTTSQLPTLQPTTPNPINIDELLTLNPLRSANVVVFGYGTSCGEHTLDTITVKCPSLLGTFTPQDATTSCQRVSETEIQCTCTTPEGRVYLECASTDTSLLNAEYIHAIGVASNCDNLLLAASIRNTLFFGGAAHHYATLGRYCSQQQQQQQEKSWEVWNSYQCAQGIPWRFPRPLDDVSFRPDFNTQIYCLEINECSRSVDCGNTCSDPDSLAVGCDVAVATVQIVSGEDRNRCRYVAGDGPSLQTMKSLMDAKITERSTFIQGFVDDEINDRQDDRFELPDGPDSD